MPTPDRTRRLITFAVTAAILIAAPLAVVASDVFNDVPDSNVFHDDITWLADNGVTLGCNPPDNDEFCPDDNVTRAQMAAFMRRLAENQVVDAATAQEASSAGDSDTVGGESPAELASLAFGDTCGTACPNDDDQMAQAEVDVPASGVVELNHSLSVQNTSGSPVYAITWASQGACETEVILIVPIPGNAIPGSLAYSHVPDGTNDDTVNISGSTTVAVDAGTTSFSSCLIFIGDHDVQQGTITGTWNPGSGGVGLADASDVVTFSDQEIEQFEEKLGGSPGS